MQSEKSMICPKCASNFEQVTTPYGDVERCLACQGLWFDMLEYEDLKDIAEGVDIGDPAIGEKYNEIGDINCPVCPNTKMLKMVDPQQPHIWFESCPACYGRFYDAGEFKDLSEYTLSDFLKRFSIRERK